ncbi:MAG TPA: hypothetical protein VGM94_15585 [Galbitalea sp.]|jgi:hypothetical protein
MTTATGFADGGGLFDDLIAALQADALTVLDEAPRLGVFDTTRRQWVTGSGVFDFDDVTVEGFDRSAPYIAIVAGSVFTVEGGAASLSIELASRLQDHVMDVVNHGWPEAYEYDRFNGLLEPGTDAFGRVGWLLGGKLVAQFGDLAKRA